MSENWTRRTLDVGDRVASYEVESFVARGGMAVVYRARDLRLDRTVALKVIAPELASNDKFRQRFMRESELAASIDHPNIIPIYAAGEADQLLYLVMRYVPGADLGTVINDRGVLRPQEVLPLFTQVAGALDAAHARQLVHRDVKPGNILLSGEDDLARKHVYLTDFGLTKRLSSLTGFTTAGHFLGTIQYVAPEQVANLAVDHRTDIYSLACVIYEALVGEPPFVADNDAALLWSHMTQEPPSISSRRDDLPKALDPVFAQALSKQPEERPANCRALLTAMREAFRPRNRTPTAAGPTAPREASGPPRRPSAAQPTGQPPTAGQRPGTSTAATTAAPGPVRSRSSHQAPLSRPPRPSRRARLTAGLLALALVIGLGTWLIVDRVWCWQTYPGTFPDARVQLEHPCDWEARSHSRFAVLAPTDLTSLFQPTSTWDEARRVAASAPDELVGTYVDTAGWLSPTPLDPLDKQVSRQFSASADVKTVAQQPAGTPDGAQGLVGTMTALDGATSPRLYFELVTLRSGSARAVVMVFCREEDKNKNAKTFRRVLESVKLP